MKLDGAAWAFVAPALLVIAVFFLLPVLAGLALSFTDFDIYALADLRNLRFFKRRRNRIPLVKRHRAGSDRHPRALRGSECSAVLYPRNVAACLPTRVRDLNPRHSALFLDERRDPRQHFDVRILVDAVVSRCDASASLHRSRFHHHQSGAAHRPAAEMNQMPIVREAVVG